MKKFSTAIAGVTIALGLSACGSATESGSEVSDWPSNSAIGSSMSDSEFGSLIREGTGVEGTDAEWVSAAKATCRSFDNGTTFEDMVEAQTSNGFSYYEAGFIIGASVSAYCPEHSDKFE